MKKYRSHKLLAVTLVMMFLLALTSCAKRTESVEFVNKETSVSIGDRLPLQTVITPSDATNQEVSFMSSNEGIATIEGTELYAIAEGNVTIKAMQGNKTYGSYTLQINPVLPTDIKFDPKIVDLGIGRSTNLIANLLPQNTTDKTVAYTTSDPAIAQINGDKVTAISQGTALITATHPSGLSAKCTVNAIPILPDSMEISGVSSFHVNSTETLTVVFNPVDVTDKNIAWTSSDRSIVSIENGLITANKIGTAEITALHASGVSATKEIEITPILAKTVTLSSKSGNKIYAKGSLELTAKILPEDTTDKSIIWSSDNTAIATVKNGKVTGIAAGTTTIRATTVNQVEATLGVTVRPSTQDMKVTVSAYCSGYNHVGNDWGEYFSVNSTQISSGDVVSITRNKDVSVYTKIEEYDAVPDIGTGSYSKTVSTEYFENGFTITQTINVRENRGRYSGSIATWTVNYEFTPI